MLSHEEEAALILDLQEVYAGRADVLEGKACHIDFHYNSSAALEALARDHRDGIARILRHPKYIDAVSAITDLIASFQYVYAETIEGLMKTTPNHSGSEGKVFFRGHNGRSATVKSFSGRRLVNFLTQFLALIRTTDISGTPKVKAASMQKGVIVTDTLEGAPLSNFEINGSTPYHDGHIRDYLGKL